MSEPSERNLERALDLLAPHELGCLPAYPHPESPALDTVLGESIATALDEAEQHGAERERKACAVDLDELAERDNRNDHWISARVYQAAAAAIRKRARGGS